MRGPLTRSMGPPAGDQQGLMLLLQSVFSLNGPTLSYPQQCELCKCMKSQVVSQFEFRGNCLSVESIAFFRICLAGSM